MPNQRATVFVSATSQDLSNYRRAVTEQLLTAGIFPIVQEYFPPDYRELDRFLHREIEQCDAVICLVGFVFGCAPPNAPEPRRSYTQIEYDVARKLNIPVFIFFAEPDCPWRQTVVEPEADRELQLAHREALRNSGYKWEAFHSEAEMRLRVATLVGNDVLQSRSTRLPLRMLHPPRYPAWFAGRSLELRQLETALTRASPAVIAVAGLGGQGKTTLVAHWLRQQARIPFDAAFWCSAYRDGLTFDEFLDELLRYLTQGEFDKRDCVDVRSRRREVMRLVQERGVLIVVDGIERWLKGWRHDPHRAQPESSEQREGSEEGLDDFLLEISGLTNGSHLVLTTRALPAVLDDASCALVPVDDAGRQIALEGLDEDAAVALLRSLEIVGDEQSLREVCREYDHHPLALSVLAGRLAQVYGGRIDRAPRVEVFDKRRRLHELFEETRRCLPGGADDERFLGVAAQCLENPSIATIAAGLDGNVELNESRATDLAEQAAGLAAWQIVEWDGYHETVGFHPLVRQYFAERAPDRPAIHRRLSAWYAAQRIAENPSTLEQARTRILAVEHALRAGDIEACQTLLLQEMGTRATLVSWLAAWGHFQTGIDLLGRAISATPESAQSRLLTDRGVLLRQFGKLDEALADFGTRHFHAGTCRCPRQSRQCSGAVPALPRRGGGIRSRAAADREPGCPGSGAARRLGAGSAQSWQRAARAG
jgi:Domain of unknown function (DUF4062)/NB-ARC domain